MLYIFYGEGEIKARDKARRLISGLQQKAPDAELLRITDDTYETVDIDGLLSTQGLFKSNYILFLDNIDSVILGFSDIQLDRMKQSKHICVVLMGKLNASHKRQVEKYANKITSYEKSGADPKKDIFDVFSMANALRSRDKQELWQQLTEARLSGANAEATTGMLFWAAKDILVKRQYNKWSTQEAQELVLTLASLPHKARRGGVVLYDSLEEFALKL